jgi:hypothetical protein
MESLKMCVKIPEDLKNVLRAEERGDYVALVAHDVYVSFFRGPDRIVNATQALRLVAHLADGARSKEHEAIEAKRPTFARKKALWVGKKRLQLVK